VAEDLGKADTYLASTINTSVGTGGPSCSGAAQCSAVEQRSAVQARQDTAQHPTAQHPTGGTPQYCMLHWTLHFTAGPPRGGAGPAARQVGLARHQAELVRGVRQPEDDRLQLRGLQLLLNIEKLLQVAVPAKYEAYGSMRSGGLASFPGDDGGLPVFEDLLAEKLLQVALPAEYEAYGDRPVRHNQQQGDGHLPLRPDAPARRERGGDQEAAADAGERAPGRGEGD
jgi:hypothetical protein